MIGKTILHYKILDKLGEGGMGVVYKAEDTKLDRFVALKFLPKGIEADDSERARFLQEAKAASALSHPNVCIIHDIQEYEGQQFIVMEYVDGVTLRQKIVGAIRESPLKLKEIIDWAIQIGEALQEAHSKGIIHRDIKSDNIMINEKGQVKVMDFGLAKLKGSLKLTKTSSTVGTLAYMSPEQIKGEKTDARMDIFSFGVVFYEMLTCHLPFRGEYESALMYSILNTEPEPVTKYRPELSSGFLFLLDKALEKEPNERYQSVSEILVDLRRLKRDTSKVSRKIIPETAPVEISEQPTPEVPVAPYKKLVGAIGKSPLIYASAAMLIIILVFVVYFLWGGRPSIPKLVNPTRVTTSDGVEDYPTWSPDGRTLAYQLNGDIWIKQVAGGPPVNLTVSYSGEDMMPSLSPDGNQIAFWSDREGGGYFVMPAIGGGTPRKVTARTDFLSRYIKSQPQLSMDGKKLACLGTDSTESFIEIVSLEYATSQKIYLSGKENKSFFRGRELNWSPNERYFAYVYAVDRESPIAELWVMRIADGVSFPVTDGKMLDWSPNWSQDGRTLYFVSNRGGSFDLWQQMINEDGTPKDSPRQLTTGIEMQVAKFSPDGKKLVYSKGHQVSNIWCVPIPQSGKQPATLADAKQITFDQVSHRGLNVSPDGKSLVFESDIDGQRHMWIMNLESREVKRVTSDPMPQIRPGWSPDGRELAFHSDYGMNVNICVVGMDGGPVRRLTNQAFDVSPRWSPDGKDIAFFSFRSGNGDIWIISAQGGEAKQLTFSPAFDGYHDWSWDGKWIIFQSERSGENELWRIPSAGGHAELVTERRNGYSVLSQDGKKIYFKAEEQIWEIPVDGGKERQLTNLAGKPYNLGDIHPETDGKYIYFTSGESIGDIWVMDVEWSK